MTTKLLSETEVEVIYGLKRRSLQKWRCVGGGPQFIKVGRSVRYRQKDIEDFIEARIRTSTSSYAS
jgi:predicted DNA-binding transcriptional regulator AlpA